VSDEEPIWIDARDAVALHGRILALHGGAEGLRDEGLLNSALALRARCSPMRSAPI
jgi:death on curing protein